MRCLALARTHARLAGRQKVLWLASIPLTVFATLLAVTSPAWSGTGGVQDLVFTAQALAIFTGIAYAASFPDFFTSPARLGIDELEASAPVSPLALRAARLLGTLIVVAGPSFAVLMVMGIVQSVTGNPASGVLALLIAVTIVAPAALISMTLSAVAGCLLPAALGRIAGMLVWCLLVFSTPLISVPTPNGTVFTIVGDAIASGWFDAKPIYPPQGRFAYTATPLSAALSLASELLLVAALLATGSALASRTRRR